MTYTQYLLIKKFFFKKGGIIFQQGTYKLLHILFLINFIKLTVLKKQC